MSQVSKYGLLALVITALLIGFVIRTQNLGSLLPFEADERVWLLVGTSLIQKGVPASWTIYWEKYLHTETFLYGGQDHLVVTPFLDHPPLFSIGVGIWAALTGNNTYQPLHWAVLRLPMIAIAAGTLVVTGLFLNKLFSPTQAAVTLIAFSFFPAHIIASRFIAAEHAIAFLLVLCLYAFAVVDKEKNKDSHKATLATAIIAIVCSTAILFKLSAIVIPATIGLLALLRKNWHLFVVTTIATLISIAALLFYGAYYDWGIFMSVLGGHTARSQSFWHFWSIFTQMDLGYFPMRDPSFIVGMIGLFTLLTNTDIAWGKRLYIFAPLFNLSLLFLFIAPVESYGWYKYIWFPFLAIGLGYVFTELWRGRVVYYVLILPLIAVMLEQSNFADTHAHSKLLVLVFYGLIVFSIILKHYFSKIKILPLTCAVSLAFLFFFELAWVSTLIPNY